MHFYERMERSATEPDYSKRDGKLWGYFRHQFWNDEYEYKYGDELQPAYAQEAYLIEQNIRKYHCKSIILTHLIQNVIPQK